MSGLSNDFAILSAMVQAEDCGEDVASAARAAAKHLTVQQYARVIARLEEAGWVRAIVQGNGGGEFSVVYPEAVLMKGRAARKRLESAPHATVNIVGSEVGVLNLGAIERVNTTAPSIEEADQAH